MDQQNVSRFLHRFNISLKWEYLPEICNAYAGKD